MFSDIRCAVQFHDALLRLAPKPSSFSIVGSRAFLWHFHSSFTFYPSSPAPVSPVLRLLHCYPRYPPCSLCCMSLMSNRCEGRLCLENQPIVLILGCRILVREWRECQSGFHRHFFSGIEPLSSSIVEACHACSPSRFVLSASVEDRQECQP